MENFIRKYAEKWVEIEKRAYSRPESKKVLEAIRRNYNGGADTSALLFEALEQWVDSKVEEKIRELGIQTVKFVG